MRLLTLGDDDELFLTEYFYEDKPHYAVLSHTWGPESSELSYQDMLSGTGKQKTGYRKLLFCAQQARRDGLLFCWVDTCCIDKSNHNELSEAITSMYNWYRNAVECYVFLSDVTYRPQDVDESDVWNASFCASRWFKRGWTLQELIAPLSLKFYNAEYFYLGNKKTLEGQIQKATRLPADVIQGGSLDIYSVEERLEWSQGRKTKRIEDTAYCLLGLFGIFMPLLYGEGDNAFIRLREHIDIKVQRKQLEAIVEARKVLQPPNLWSHLPNEGYVFKDELIENLTHEQVKTIADVVIQNCQQACFNLDSAISMLAHLDNSPQELTCSLLATVPDYKSRTFTEWLVRTFWGADHGLLDIGAIKEHLNTLSMRDSAFSISRVTVRPSNIYCFEDDVWNARILCSDLKHWESEARLTELYDILAAGKLETDLSYLLPPHPTNLSPPTINHTDIPLGTQASNDHGTISLATSELIASRCTDVTYTPMGSENSFTL